MALELAGEWPARGLKVLLVAGLPAAIEAGSLPYLAKPFRPLHIRRTRSAARRHPGVSALP
jgi:hypothetical protein